MKPYINAALVLAIFQTVWWVAAKVYPPQATTGEMFTGFLTVTFLSFLPAAFAFQETKE